MPERIEDYEVLGIIGTGSFGTCYKVRKRNTSHVFVWKAVDYGSMSEERKKLLVSEVNLLRELRHPNIVRYYDRILHKESATIYIIMEWCVGGDLATMITKCKRSNTYLEEAFIWRVLYQTSRALQACHSPGRPVLHRDIKPANLFLDSDFNVKLGDFGLARILTNAKDDDEEDENDSLYAQTVVGTPFYMSPEVVKGSKYNRKSDIWSLGCVIYELCSLTPPFSSGNIKSLTVRIKGGRFERIPSHYSDELQQMIMFMLTVNHEVRPSIETILHHPSVVTHIAKWSLTRNLYRNTNKENEKSDPVKGADVVLNETFCSCVGDCCANESPLSNAPCQMPKEASTANLDSNEAKVSQAEVDFWRHRETDGSIRLKGNVSAKKGTEQESVSSITEKMNLLRQREAKLRMRELSLEERERNVRKKEREAALASRLARETMGRACVYLNTCRDGRGSACSNVTKITLRSRSPSDKTPSFPDADSSFDQEQGETSVMAATSTRLDPKYVNKPMWHGSMTAPRRVTFSLKNYNETHVDPSLIDNKKNTALLTEVNGGRANALKSVHSSNTQAWLESKRQIHKENVNSLGKENVVPMSRSVNKVSSKKSSLPHLFGKSGKTL